MGMKLLIPFLNVVQKATVPIPTGLALQTKILVRVLWLRGIDYWGKGQ
jgi:hypothetical protein